MQIGIRTKCHDTENEWLVVTQLDNNGDKFHRPSAVDSLQYFWHLDSHKLASCTRDHVTDQNYDEVNWKH